MLGLATKLALRAAGNMDHRWLKDHATYHMWYGIICLMILAEETVVENSEVLVRLFSDPDMSFTRVGLYPSKELFFNYRTNRDLVEKLNPPFLASPYSFDHRIL